MLPRHDGPVHVTVCGRHVRGDQGIVIHEASSLKPHEIRERHGIPLTAPVRTLVDLAADCSDRDLHQAVAEAFALRLTTLPSLQRAAAAYRGRRGVGRLLRLLEGGPRRTRSRRERRLLTAVQHDPVIPDPETNVNIGRWEVDFLWRDAGVAVEVDDYSTHSSPQSFERDRRKDAELGALGLTVQRFTSTQVDEDLGFILGWLRQSV
jgi:very-short-patch-repair endonuclease